MLHNDLIGLGLYMGYFIVIGLPLLLFNMYFDAPFEVIAQDAPLCDHLVNLSPSDVIQHLVYGGSGCIYTGVGNVPGPQVGGTLLVLQADCC